MRKLKSILIGLCMGLLFGSLFLGLSPVLLVQVSSTSMEPSFKDGSRILIHRVDDNTALRVGDVITFFAGDGTVMLKRIVGCDGSVVSLENNEIRVDGIPISVGVGNEWTGTLDEDQFYVVGDNISESIDSRHWENPIVERRNILGVVKE